MFSATSLIALFSSLTLLCPATLAQSNYPPVTAFQAGSLLLETPGRFCDFTNGGFAQFQGDGNVVVYTFEDGVLWDSAAYGGELVPGAPAAQCPAAGPCVFSFQNDGNLVAYFDNVPLWNSETGGRGEWFVCQETAPYLYITDAGGNTVWSAS